MNQKAEKGKPKSKLRYTIPLILIILVIAAILIVPRYNSYLKNKRAAEIKTAIETVRLHVDQAWHKAGTISGIKLENVIKQAGISPKVLNNWQFYVSWKQTDVYTTEIVNKLKDVNPNQTIYVAPYRMILAVATADNPVGEGTKVWFSDASNSYHGFGIDNQVEPDWAVIFPNP